MSPAGIKEKIFASQGHNILIKPLRGFIKMSLQINLVS